MACKQVITISVRSERRHYQQSSIAVGISFVVYKATNAAMSPYTAACVTNAAYGFEPWYLAGLRIPQAVDTRASAPEKIARRSPRARREGRCAGKMGRMGVANAALFLATTRPFRLVGIAVDAGR